MPLIVLSVPLHFALVRTNIVDLPCPQNPSGMANSPTSIRELEVLPRPFVDRATVEFLLGVGRRRAQQIMAPCVNDRVGVNGLADRAALIDRLRRLGQGDDGFHEVERRRKVAHVLEQLRKTRLEKPQLLVEAPVAVVNQEIKDLPAGIHIEAGRITIEFEQPQQALERLLALAMAISNDYDRFERRAGKSFWNSTP